MFKKFFSFSVLAMMLMSSTAANIYTAPKDKTMSLAEKSTGQSGVSDPLWCPDGVAPIPNMNGCTASYPNLQALVLDMANGSIPQPVFNGTIWIEMGTDSSLGNIIIDGNVLPPNWAFTGLTLQGGWDGISGSTGTPGDSEINRFIHILNWKGPVTVNKIRIFNTSNTGLAVTTNREIKVDNVISSGNNGDGAYLDNYQSAWATYGVTLTGSNDFEDNSKSGLNVKSYGVIDLENITANANGYTGAQLKNIWGDTNVGVNISGTNMFRGNGYNGIFVDASGDIVASNISAIGNGSDGEDSPGAGAVLQNTWSTNYASVTLTGKNDFESNKSTGLAAISNGKVLVENVTSDGNGIYGVTLGTADMDDPAYASVELNVAHIDRNGCNGLTVNSTGPIKLWLISATGNGYSPIEDDLCLQNSGIYLNNSGKYSANAGVDISVVKLENNNPHGLHVLSKGDITINNLGSDKNGFLTPGNGALLDNCISNGKECEGSGAITLNNIGFNDNALNGLSALSSKDITISNSIAEQNGEDGFSLQNNSNMNVYCSQLIDNKGYGIDAILPGVLNLFNVIFSGNTLGDTNISGGGTIQIKEYECSGK